MSDTDPLPKIVCLECWTKIADFHEFYQKIHTAQANYLSELVKSEQENHFIDVSVPHIECSEIESIDELYSLNGGQNESTIKIEYDNTKVDFSPFEISEASNKIDIELPDDGDALQEDTFAEEQSEDENLVGNYSDGNDIAKFGVATFEVILLKKILLKRYRRRKQ